MFPAGQFIIDATGIAQTLLSVLLGVFVAVQFKFTPIQTGSVGMATFLGSGVLEITDEGAYVVSGTGDIINAMLTAAIAAGLVLLVGNRLKGFSMIVLPPLTLLVAGGIGTITLPYVSYITTAIGVGVNAVADWQPVVMGVVLAVFFSVMTVTPVSMVAVAAAISLSGVGAGAASLGVTAAAIGLGICGWRVNTIGTSLAVIFGAPKVHMGNFFRKPKILVPTMCNAAILGVLAAAFNIQSSPSNAAFGISGFVGPVTALGLADGGWNFTNILIVVFVYIVMPVVLGLLFNHVFKKIVPLVKAEDYKLDFD